MQEITPELVLVNDATKELAVLMNSIEVESLTPEQAAPGLLQALAYGADPESPIYRPALEVMARNWRQDYQKPLAPVLDRLMDDSSSLVRQKALSCLIYRPLTRSGRAFASRLIQAGADVHDDRALVNMSFNIDCMTDTAATALVRQLIGFGWSPTGGEGEQRVLASIVRNRHEKTLSTWLELHRANGCFLPPILTQSASDPVSILFRDWMDLGQKRPAASAKSRRMIEAIGLSGLLPPHPSQKWRQPNGVEWISEMFSRGDEARMEMNTSPVMRQSTSPKVRL